MIRAITAAVGTLALSACSPGKAALPVGATAPDQGPHHLDFFKVNQTLNALEPQVRESFEEGVLLELDRQFAGLDNIVDNFSITAAREAAWVHGEVLWRLHDESWLAESFLTTLDRTVGFAGRALLTHLRKF